MIIMQSDVHEYGSLRRRKNVKMYGRKVLAFKESENGHSRLLCPFCAVLSLRSTGLSFDTQDQTMPLMRVISNPFFSQASRIWLKPSESLAM